MWRPSRKHGLRIAVIHRPRYDDWSLPKGKAEPGETMPVAAAREIAEETGFLVALGRRVGQARYRVSAGQKTVEYYSAAVLDGRFVPNKEVDRLEWLSVSAARRRLSYEFDRDVVDRFTELPLDLATVILVRHARAGHRESFAGDDNSRPLDGKGRRQALALATDLLPFAPSAVYSAPLVRCWATLEPLANRLGVPITAEPDLAEETYRDDPGAARRKVLQFAGESRRFPPVLETGTGIETATGNGTAEDLRPGHGLPGSAVGPEPLGTRAGRHGAVVAGSQGGVIPGVVKSLAARGRITTPREGTQKGSYWVLSFDGRRLVQADHHAAPDV